MAKQHTESPELQAIAERMPVLLDGDLETILRVAGPMVVRRLRRGFSGSSIDVDQVVVDAVERFSRYRRGFDHRKGTLTQYLYAIARSLAIDQCGARPIQIPGGRDPDSFGADQRGRDESEAEPTAEAAALRDIFKMWTDIDQELMLAWAACDGEPGWASEFAARHQVSSAWVRQRRLRLERRLRQELTRLGFRVAEQGEKEKPS